MPKFTELSVVIITLNEQENLSRCLASIPKGTEIVVLDSGSKDATIEIAKKFEASVHSRSFDNFAAQKNAAIDLATRDWVLSLDADEVLTDELIASLESVDDKFAAYKIRRELVFMQKRMKFGKTTDYPIRLFKKGRARFESRIHEKLEVSGLVGKIEAPLLHYSYADIEDYFKRFNRYTGLIAENHLNTGKNAPNLVAHVMRPWFEFINRYVFRLGFLDGYPGYCYALFSSFYAFVKYAKLSELAKKKHC